MYLSPISFANFHIAILNGIKDSKIEKKTKDKQELGLIKEYGIMLFESDSIYNKYQFICKIYFD